MATGPRILAGCAGWGLPKAQRRRFPRGESNLERYAARLPAAEINSSFYRLHAPAVYARWRDSVPPGFRFSVKMPKEISHGLRLQGAAAALDVFLAGPAALGRKLGCLLLQLPPSLAFDRGVAKRFFTLLRRKHAGAVAVEPRHASWFTPEADELLAAFRIARVAADPPRAAGDGAPGGSTDIVYYRLHGSPKIYFSSYAPDYLRRLAVRLKMHTTAWCIFDNTASGAATANALDLLQKAGKL